MTKDSSYLPRLPKLDWVQGIRDPIWGEIGITDIEKKIIQTETFSRLRGIKQLSFAYLAFPGAVHSRFEHSIGVMHVTGQLLKSIKGEEPPIEIRSEDRQLLRLAALLHDIGHSPFSHAMENLFSYYPEVWRDIKEDLPTDFKNFMKMRGKDYGAPSKHENFTAYLICTDPDIQRILKEWVKETNQGSFMKMGEDRQEAFIRDVVAQLAIGEEVTSSDVGEPHKGLSKLFTCIMSGDIDADKIDYLARDNYYCGLPYELDLTSLREQLIVDDNQLTLLPNGIKFVNTVILARYWLFTEVHQHMRDTFTTAKVIELLHKILMESPNRAELIFNIFTKWQDSKLIDLLIDSNDREIRKVLTTERPIKEIEHLDYLETHPYVRVVMQVLSENENHHHIPLLQEDLREVVGRDDLFIHINRIKSPSFGMKVKGGNLLRNEILRGISEESLKNLKIVVYGKDTPTMVPIVENIKVKVNALPEQSEQIDNYLEHLGEDHLKKLLAYLAIRGYRNICQECSKQNMILASDFLFLVMEAISNVSQESRKSIDHPSRQNIYKIARLIHKTMSDDGIRIRGDVYLENEEITPSFHKEIRKYEQMGLISYSRNMERMKREDVEDESDENRLVFRFDRRFKLSKYGRERLEKIRDLRSVIPEYKAYLNLWDKITMSVETCRLEIEELLTENSHSNPSIDTLAT
jgi:HD superfamily phosphohydrolase